MQDVKEIIRASVALIVDAAFEIIQSDFHEWSDRPCSTCRGVSALIGKPFGCYAYQEKKKRKEKT